MTKKNLTVVFTYYYEIISFIFIEHKIFGEFFSLFLNTKPS